MYSLKKLIKRLDLISIDLDAQYVSSFTEVFLLKNSFQTLLYALQNNSTLFPINNMSFTYTYQKCYSAPTHFLVNTGFTASLYNTICFDQLIKAYIPTLRCLHQSIDGLLELFILVSVFQDCQNLLVVSHTTFPQENRRGNNVLTSYLHDFINNVVTANPIPTAS